MQIRPYSINLQLDALALLESSDSTPRSKQTWDNNCLTAVMAYHDGEAVGIIPLEPRKLKISSHAYVNGLWVSGAHVQQSLRSQGVGASMDDAIQGLFPLAGAVFAYRHDSTSRATKWYLNQGYKILCPITALKIDVTHGIAEPTASVIDNRIDLNRKSEEMMRLFEENLGDFGGYPMRHNTFWVHHWDNNYYRQVYKFLLLVIEDKSKLLAYAFLGQTNYRDGINRLDILECICPPSSTLLRPLIEATIESARQRNLSEVRIQCATNDPMTEQFKALGFTERWMTNILGKPLQPGHFADKLHRDPVPFLDWRHFQLDYI